MQRTLTALFFVLASFLAATAKGDNRDVAREHYLQGTKDFDLGLYDDAIKEYMAAYQAKDDPALLYNLGQAHRAAQHAVEALHFYKRYLTKVPDAPNAAEVQAKIGELQKLIDQQTKLQAMPPAGPAPLGSSQTTSAPRPTPTTETPVVENRQPNLTPAPVEVVAAAPAPTPVYKKWWLWTIVGVVVVGAAVGVSVGLSSGGGSSFNPSLGATGPGAH